MAHLLNLRRIHNTRQYDVLVGSNRSFNILRRNSNFDPRATKLQSPTSRVRPVAKILRVEHIFQLYVSQAKSRQLSKVSVRPPPWKTSPSLYLRFVVVKSDNLLCMNRLPQSNHSNWRKITGPRTVEVSDLQWLTRARHSSRSMPDFHSNRDHEQSQTRLFLFVIGLQAPLFVSARSKIYK